MPDGGGIALGQAVGVVTIEAQLSTAAGQISQFSQQTEKQMGRVSASTESAGNALHQLAGAFGVSLGVAGLAQLVKWTDETAKMAAQADRTRQAYDDLAGSFGQDADSMLQSMRTASEGMISDSNLVLSANKAMLLGVADTGQEMGNLLEIAHARGAAMGESTEQAFNDIVTGIGRLSPRILDNLGIVIDSQQAYDDYARSIDVSADALTDAEKKHALYLAILKDSKTLVDDQKTHVDNLADQYERLATAEDNARMAAGKFFAEAGSGNTKFWTDINNGIARWLDFFRQYSQATDKWHVFDPSNPIGHRTGIGQAHPEAFPTPMRVNPKQAEVDQAIIDRYSKLQDIERQANADILNENTSYQSRRLRSEQQYQDNVAQSAADFAKNRMRAQEDYENSILDIMRQAQQRDARMAEDHARAIARMQSDSAKRLGDLQEDLDRNNAQKRIDSADKVAEMAADADGAIADKRQDSTDRLLDIEKEYARQQEDAARQHQTNRLEAAARLDARALFFEDRRFNDEQQKAADAHQDKVDDEKDKLQKSLDNINESYNEKLQDEQKALEKSIRQANEAHDRQVKDEQEALQTRIDDANDAYTRQLQDARDADDQRIKDMAAHFDEQKRREDDDQVERMGRMASDHTAEMTQMDTEHNERLTQIGTQKGEERTALDAEFRKQLHDLGVHNDAYDKAEAQHKEQIRLSQAIFQEEEKKQLADAQLAMLKILNLNPFLSAGEQSALTTATTALGQAVVTYETNIGLLNGQLNALPKNPYVFGPVADSQVQTSGFVQSGGIIVPAQLGVTGSGGASALGNSLSIGAINVTVNAVATATANSILDVIDERILRTVQMAAGRL